MRTDADTQMLVNKIAELKAENERLRKELDQCIGVDHILAARDAAQKLEVENERLRREVQHYKNIAYNNYF